MCQQSRSVEACFYGAVYRVALSISQSLTPTIDKPILLPLKGEISGAFYGFKTLITAFLTSLCCIEYRVKSEGVISNVSCIWLHYCSGAAFTNIVEL